MGPRLGPHVGWLIGLIALPAVVIAQAFKHVDHPHWTSEYDHYFKKSAKHYFGTGFDWRWFKAQAITESGLEARARSKGGALGLMQILPATFAEIRAENPHFGSAREPKWNIAAGIYYDRTLYRKFPKAPEQDRLYLALASYNAGFGKIRKAYRKALREAQGPKRWPDVARYAPGRTRHYVRRIHRLMRLDLG